jgi:5-methylcytosine-specific restriction enzyme A
MARASKRICPRCRQPYAGRCEKCGRRRPGEQQRPSAAKRMYGREWRKRRAEYLRENPLCVECKKEGIIRAATVVDHIIPHRGDPVLFWDESNWQALDATCHNSKTGSGQ